MTLEDGLILLEALEARLEAHGRAPDDFRPASGLASITADAGVDMSSGR